MRASPLKCRDFGSVCGLSDLTGCDFDRILLEEDGRVHFTVPDLFETSLALRGAQKDDGWFFGHVEFLHKVGGDLTDVQG